MYKQKLIVSIFRLLFAIFSKLPIKKNYIIFESFHGKQFSDNPRAIFEYINDKYPNQYNLIWAMDRRSKAIFSSGQYKKVTRLSIKWCYYMSVSRFWVFNTRMPLWLPKRTENIYLQTWHGTPLKKLGLDIEEVKMPGTTTEKYKENFSKSSSKWDYLLSPNNYSSKIFRSAFDFQGEILEVGYPRNDYLSQKNDSRFINSIKKDLNISNDKKVILYAPTWRDDNYFSKGNYRFQLEIDLNKIKKLVSDEYVIVLRMHYLIAEQLDLSSFGDFVIDCSLYDDIRNLYLISDILITDYSSVFFDYSVLQRPIIFFMYDLDKYKDTLRGFYINDLSELPGEIARTNADLLRILEKVIYRNEFKNYDFFYTKFCSLEDGKASQRVFDSVIKDN